MREDSSIGFPDMTISLFLKHSSAIVPDTILVELVPRVEY